MFLKLKENDKKEVLQYLEEESAINLFVIGDIENYGMETYFLDVWGDVVNNKLRAVLLRYYNYFVLYSKNNDYDAKEVDEILRCHSIIEGLSGKKTVIDNFIMRSSLRFDDIKNTFFLRLNKPVKKQNFEKDNKFLVIIGKENDIEGVIDLYKEIDEFGEITESAREILKTEVKNKDTRLYIVNHKGEIVSTARTTAENSKSAMIISVATRKEYRNKGLATKCVRRLCEDLLAEGKEICLFYDNPGAGSIYKAIGFEELDMWTIIKKVNIC